MKIAAYCRVSTDKADQTNSFEGQQRYFREYIQRHPDWNLYEIYADEGMSGTSTRKRTAFNRMIADAQAGKFDLIITKEVSRFARNTVDTLQFTRELKSRGVGVLFMNDGINTLDPDAELRLSIMSSIAQEESRKTSSRVKWGQARRMEQGIVFGRSLLGYDVKEGHMTIDPEGARLVRLIYHKCIEERKGTTRIARELKEAGYRTARGNTDWQSSVILRILKNEKYCGDLLQKKTITPDYLTHQKKYNHGEETMIYIKDHHEAIIDRDVWQKAQQELKRRSMKADSGGHGNRHPLSGKIKCSSCGKSFSSRMRKRKDGSRYGTWRCDTTCKQGRQHTDRKGRMAGCNISYQIRTDAAIDMIRQAAATLPIDMTSTIAEVTDIVMQVLRNHNHDDTSPSDSGGRTRNIARLTGDIAALQAKKKKVLNAYFTNIITREEMHMMNDEYDSRLNRLLAQLHDNRILPVLPSSADETPTAAPAASAPPAFTAPDAGCLRKEIQEQLAAIAGHEDAPDSFYGTLVDQITAYPDKTITLSLRQLPSQWKFVLTGGSSSQPSLSDQQF